MNPVVEQIIKSLEENTLTRLTLVKSYGGECVQILKKLEKNKSVQIFDACDAMLDNRACAQSLNKFLSSNQSMILLDLSGNDFVDDNYLQRVFDKTVSQNFANRAQKMTLMLGNNNQVTTAGLEHLQGFSNIEVAGLKVAQEAENSIAQMPTANFPAPATAPATNNTAAATRLATSKTHGLA